MVSRTGEGTALIGAPGHAPDVVCMALQDTQAEPCLHVPQPYGTVPRAGEGVALIGAPRHAIDDTRVTFEDA